MTIDIRRLDSAAPDFRARLAGVLAFEASEDAAIDQAAARILADVKARGDAAVLDCTRRFDHVQADSVAAFEIGAADLRAALDGLPDARRAALQAAADRVRAYHERQKAECGSDGFSYTEADGTVLGQKVTPLDRVGIYVPGGKAAYPSSVLMNAIPARVAGVGEIVMVVPTPDGVRNPLVLAAAAIAGVDRVFTIGGAQAVGALAYGTATIPQVDKIVGPDNAYVAAAKRRVFGTVGIDMIAGPSEILVLCDGTTDPDWVAMDLFSQAEHDELAQAMLLTPDDELIDRVAASAERLIASMPRAAIIASSLARRGALIRTRDLDEACAIANRIAPEHLELAV
ncbi:MAG: histidinol dehydrogenase, partial [Burkholderiaceae bacterium]